MSKLLELPDETYERIVSCANAKGITPAELLDSALRVEENVSEIAPKPAKSLYDKLKPFIGSVKGNGEALAHDHSRIFGDELERQHRENKQ